MKFGDVNDKESQITKLAADERISFWSMLEQNVIYHVKVKIPSTKIIN
jgi:hypothetical protein